MVTFGLVHGSQHGGWCWERLTPELERRGHRVVAPDLPCDDPSVGMNGYATVMIEALDGFDDVVLVGHSLGSLTIPVVASRRPVDRMIFLRSVPTGPGPAIDADLATMVTPAYLDAARVIDEQERESISDRDAVVVWYADCEPDDAAWAVARLRPQSRRPLTEPGPLTEWPAVPATVILGGDDRCVSLDWAVAAATARLDGEAPIIIDGGHSPFLARPAELADLLDTVVR